MLNKVKPQQRNDTTNRRYIVTAINKDGLTFDENVMLVTDDIDEAFGYDTSSYYEPWEVWIQVVDVDDDCVVAGFVNAIPIFPKM